MIYVLDTNVLSEIMLARPNPAVVAWLRACPAAAMRTTVVSQYEIFHGMGRLPEGRRRRHLATVVHEMFDETFKDRILPLDPKAAVNCAEIRALRRGAGRPITIEDAMIAAIARRAGAAIVTRDRGGFDGCGVLVIDPWTAGA